MPEIELLDVTTQELSDSKIVGWFQGKMEWELELWAIGLF